jgi:Na+/melibiose symporter-like transporter
VTVLRAFANRIFGDILLVFNRGEEYARNRLYILRFSIYANVIAILYGGYFFTGLLLKLGADDAYMGYITVVTYLGSIAAVFSPLLVERFAKRKTMLLVSRGIYYLLLLGFITAMPYLGTGNSAKLAGILALVALVNLLSALTGSGYSVWHLQSLPESVRSGFFANLNMIIGILNMILLNLAGLFADWFKARGQELLGITLLRCMALLVAFVEIYNLSRIREYPYLKPEKRLSLRAIFTNPPKNKRYRAVMAVIVLWTFTASIPGPFYQVYLLKDLHIGYSFLSAVNLLNIPVLLIAMPLWGRVVARLGDVKLFPALAGVVSLHYLSLAFVTGANYRWFYPMSVFYYFVVAAGITQVASLMPFKFIPETNQSNFLSFYGAVNTLAALLGTLVGQRFVVATENVSMAVLSLQFGNKQLLMAATGAAILLGAVGMAFINRWLEKTNSGVGAEQTAGQAL